MTEYNIDISKLKRNYFISPVVVSKSIKKNERPYREDLEYLYIELNIPRKELCQIFGWNINSFDNWIKYYKIKKPRELSIKHMYDTNLERYGHPTIFQSPDIKNNIKETNLKRYGCEYSCQSEIVKNRIKETNLKRYGCEYYTQSSDYYQKTKNKRQTLTDCLEYRQKQRLTTFENKEKLFKERAIDLSSKELLVKCMEKNNLFKTQSLVEYFGINTTNVNRLIRRYGIRHLIKNSTSTGELYIRGYVSQYFDIEAQKRDLLNGQEIDIYIPEKKIGIEFNGNFWHSEYHKEKSYHQEKSKSAEQRGIFLYHIFEYEWNNKKDQILNQLNNLLGLNKNKIYARLCDIRVVNNTEKKIFLENYHMQGDDTSSIKLGLYYKDELVSLMTFVKPRFNKKYQWELSRFCSKSGCNVVGGASKLFKYFIREYKPTNIISYSNVAHTRGNIYKILGMEFIGYSEPNYVWFKKDKVLTRYQCQKHKLLEQGFDGKSEIDIMHNRNYYRIYDCGNKVWVFNNK